MTYAVTCYGGTYRLPVPGPLLFRCQVLGDPAAQGSKKYVGHRGGRPVLAEMAKRHKPWRAATSAAVAAALDAGHVAFDGPLILGSQFVMKRPLSKATVRGRMGMPTATPDASKLLRSVEDAMKVAGLYVDDALIVDHLNQKRYVGDPRSMLAEPGVVLWLWRHPGYDVAAKPAPDQPIPLFP